MPRGTRTPHLRTHLRRLVGRASAVDDLALRVSRLERDLTRAKRALQKAGGSANLLSEPSVLLDYPRHEVRIVASAWKRRASVAKEPYTVGWIEETLSPADVLYDIGANIGAYALIAAVVQPKAQVVAFEPSFENYAALCRNIFLNDVGDRLMALPVALGSTSGVAEMHYNDLAVGRAQHHIGDGAPFEAVFRQRLMGLRIDDLAPFFGLPAPTHIKLDVDGAELTVLQGATRTLSSPVLRELHVETEPGDERVPELLVGFGFEAVDWNESPQVMNVRFSRVHESLTRPL